MYFSLATNQSFCNSEEVGMSGVSRSEEPRDASGRVRVARVPAPDLPLRSLTVAPCAWRKSKCPEG